MKNMGSRLSDVARLNYKVKINLLPQDKGNTEAMVNGEQEVHFLLPVIQFLFLFLFNMCCVLIVIIYLKP